MFAGLQRRFVLSLALVLLCGHVAAQERGVWQFRHNDGHLMISTDDPLGIVVVDDNRFAAVNVAKERSVAVAGFFPTGDPTSMLKSTITMTDGREFSREMNEDAFVTHQERGVPGYAYVFIVGDQDLELLKAAAKWKVEASGIAWDFPMKGSRKAIQAAEDAAQRLKDAEALAADRGNWQRDCIRLTGHPWDKNTAGEGVAWGDLDAVAAMQACDRAIAAGVSDVQIVYLLGRALDKAGDEDAVSVLSRATERGYVPAIYHLGLLHWDGDYDLSDKDRARSLIEKASNADYLPARHKYAEIMLESGDDETRQFGTRLMRVAAEKGYPLSQKKFAELAESGAAFGEPDYGMALQFYARAADNGNAASAFRLAEMYRDGVGTAPDPRLYLEYLRHAADLGHDEAKEELGMD